MRRFVIYLSFICSFISPFAQDFVPTQAKKKVAVYVTGEDVPQGYEKVVGSKMVSVITQSEQYTAIERTNEFISVLEKEHDYQTSGAVRDNDIARIGQQMGVKFVVVVEISEIMDEIFIAARMISVETAAIVASFEAGSGIDTLAQLNELSQYVANNLIENNSATSAAPAQNNSKKESRTLALKNDKAKSFTVNNVTFDMIPVEGGTFTMGTDTGRKNCRPAHEVKVDDFLIGQTEVTQKLWEAVMGENPSIYKDDLNPVENVTYTDCVSFILKLNQLTGQNFRLPTEAEWEYAAQGGNKSRHYEYSGGEDINMVGWYKGNSEKKTHPVATLTANELGLYDMTGNVWEWTSDFDSKNYNKSKDKDKRVARGGGIESTADFCFNYFRWGFYPSIKHTEESIKKAEEEYKKMELGAYVPALLGLRLAL